MIFRPTIRLFIAQTKRHIILLDQSQTGQLQDFFKKGLKNSAKIESDNVNVNANVNVYVYVNEK